MDPTPTLRLRLKPPLSLSTSLRSNISAIIIYNAPLNATIQHTDEENNKTKKEEEEDHLGLLSEV